MPIGNFNTFGRNSVSEESLLQVHNQNLRMRQGNSNHYGPSMAAYKELDTWTHLAVVADGAQSKVYINGVLFHTFNVVCDDDISILGNKPWSQGQQTWANYIADLRFWHDFTLTEADVLEIYNASVPLPDPVASQVQANDITNYYGSATIINDYYLDGLVNDGYVRGTFSDDLRPLSSEEGFNMSIYVNLKSGQRALNQDETSNIFGAHNSQGWNIWLRRDPSANVFKITLDLNGVTDAVVSNTFALSYDEFHHIALTFIDGELKLYFDETEVHSATGYNFLPGAPNNNNFIIGQGTALAVITGMNTYKGLALNQSHISELAALANSLEIP